MLSHMARQDSRPALVKSTGTANDPDGLAFKEWIALRMERRSESKKKRNGECSRATFHKSSLFALSVSLCSRPRVSKRDPTYHLAPLRQSLLQTLAGNQRPTGGKLTYLRAHRSRSRPGSILAKPTPQQKASYKMLFAG
jgi:hypothetical protein